MRITTIFFDLYDTLVDPGRLGPQNRAALARLLSERHGGSPDEWLVAYETIRADWHSYWADLDTGGDEGLAQYEEGQWRVVRALFRLTGRDFPPQRQMLWYVRTLPTLAARHCRALHPDATACIPHLSGSGYRLGIVTETLRDVAIGLLEGAGVARYFDAPVLGIDQAGAAGKLPGAYRLVALKAGVDPETCLAVDSGSGIPGASQAGMRVALVQRRERSAGPASEPGRVAVTLHDLTGLPDWLARQASPP